MAASSTRTFKLVLAYNGARFKGWQRGNGRTVQSTLEEALRLALPVASRGKVSENPEVRADGAGRTDSGVHAERQVASVILPAAVEAELLLSAVNEELPWDLAVRSVELAHERFHARYLATAKTYRYRIVDGPAGAPLLYKLAWRVTATLDIAAMEAAAHRLLGTHDFASFTADRKKSNTTRTIHEIRVLREDVAGAQPVTVFVRGDGFLWKQVRTMVSALAACGRGEAKADVITQALASGERAFAPAPAYGLTLVDVEYGREPVEP